MMNWNSVLKQTSLSVFLACLTSCDYKTGYMDKKEDVLASTALPIDGLYEMTNNVQRVIRKAPGVFDIDRQRVRFTNGMAYYEESTFGKAGGSSDIEPGKVFIQQIKAITESKYKGQFYPIGIDTSYTVTILVDGNNLKINIPKEASAGLIKIKDEINFELIE